MTTEADKQAGALASMRRRHRGAAMRHHVATAEASGSIDSMREHTPEALASIAARAIAAGKFNEQEVQPIIDQTTPLLLPVFKRLQESHRSHDAKQQQALAWHKHQLRELIKNKPTADDTALVHHLWDERLRALSESK